MCWAHPQALQQKTQNVLALHHPLLSFHWGVSVTWDAALSRALLGTVCLEPLSEEVKTEQEEATMGMGYLWVPGMQQSSKSFRGPPKEE